MSSKETSMAPPARVMPANRFVGQVQVDQMDAKVRALACLRSGEIVVLVMNGPRTTVSAVAATLHHGGKTRRSASFTPASGEAWSGPKLLYRMQGPGSGWLASEVVPTTQLDVAVLANGANIAYCCQHPLPQPQKRVEGRPCGSMERNTRADQPRVASVPIPPPRYVLATEGATHPDWMTFTGLMRTLWLPFSLHFAPFVWDAGVRTKLQLTEEEATQLEGDHTLIEPVECALGIAAWQIMPAMQWYPLLERVSQEASVSGC